MLDFSKVVFVSNGDMYFFWNDMTLQIFPMDLVTKRDWSFDFAKELFDYASRKK